MVGAAALAWAGAKRAALVVLAALTWVAPATGALPRAEAAARWPPTARFREDLGVATK